MLHARYIILMQKQILFLLPDKLDKVLIQITLWVGKGVNRGMEVAGSILAPTFFILKLPVALAKEPSKIAFGSWGRVDDCS